jgi:hypothetical protein
MREHILHFGLPKTASSFLQERVFPRFEGLTYVGPEQIRNSAAFNHLRLADDSLYDPSAMRAMLAGLAGDRVLFSEERFGGRFLGFGGAINRSVIARRLRDLMPNARLLVFLRGQPAYIYSAYQQYIKGFARGTKPFAEFIHAPERYEDGSSGQHHYDELSLGFTPHYVFYHEMLKLYTSLFAEVKVLLFEDFIRQPEQVLREMEAFIQPRNSLVGKVNWTKKINQSVNRTGLHAIRYRNCTQFMGGGLLTKLFRELRVSLDYQFAKVAQDERATAQEMGRWFEANNAAVIKYFPWVGIQRYPEDYPIAKG